MKIKLYLGSLMLIGCSANLSAATPDELAEDVRQFQTRMANHLATSLTPAMQGQGCSTEAARVREAFAERLRSEAGPKEPGWMSRLFRIKRTAPEVKNLADQLARILNDQGADRQERALDILVKLHLVLARISGAEARFGVGAEMDELLAGLRTFVAPGWVVLFCAASMDLQLTGDQALLLWGLVYMPIYTASALWGVLEIQEWDNRPSKQSILSVTADRRAAARNYINLFWSRLAKRWKAVPSDSDGTELSVDVHAFASLGVRGQGTSAACKQWLSSDEASHPPNGETWAPEGSLL